MILSVECARIYVASISYVANISNPRPISPALCLVAVTAGDIALIDGKYLLSASKNLLINTCVDALAHAAESRVSIQTNIYNQMFANYALKLWGDIVPFLRSDEELSEEISE